MASIPIRFWAKAEDWQQWEVEYFKMLNGDRFRAWASGDTWIWWGVRTSFANPAKVKRRLERFET
jgi:hypothetical protein